MDWKNVGRTIPEISIRDLVVFHLAPEEAEKLAHQYNRALFNTNNDGADVAIITLKRIITEYPTWGEASLLFGICVAQCEEYHRAQKSFEHALTCGLHSQVMTELAQYCLSEATAAAEVQLAEAENAQEESPLKALSTAITRQESPMVAESEHRERIHVQAPILIKAPKKPRKRRIATEKEIRDALAQSTSSNGEIPDEEIRVEFPKTPAEKMRMTAIALAVIVGVVGLFFLITLVIVPAVKKATAKSEDAAKVEYLVGQLEANKGDPEIAAILSAYQAKYGEGKTDGTNASTTAPVSDENGQPEGDGESTADAAVTTPEAETTPEAATTPATNAGEAPEDTAEDTGAETAGEVDTEG